MSDPTLGHSFLAAAGELGMCSAAWLFARTLGARPCPRFTGAAVAA